MNAQTQSLTLAGPAGNLQALIDTPLASQFPAAVGTVVLAHPHPLYGGTMNNKVVQTMARGFVQCGWRAVRFNFRGVEGSQGVYDEGRGEIDDMLSVIESQAPASEPLALAGFSFGAFVTTQVVRRVWPARPLSRLILVGTAVTRFGAAEVPGELHAQTLVLHGEQDDTVPLSAVLDWARPQFLPVTVVPAGEHFFHGQLPLLKSLVARHARQ